MSVHGRIRQLVLYKGLGKMGDRSVLKYLQQLGLGNTNPWMKALPDICGGLEWPTANILATADALLLAMGESPPRNAEELSQADHLVRTRVSQLKSKAGKKWLQSGRGRPSQVIYALTFRIAANDQTFVLFIFDELLAEHIWANIIDPVTGNSYEGAQKDRRFAEKVVEGYYEFPLSEMRHKGLDIREGVWQFPFGTGSLGREQLTESIVQSVTRGPSATIAKEGPRFVGIWGFSGIGKTTLARRVKNDSRVKERFGNSVFWLTLGRAVSPDALAAHKADIRARLEKATLHGTATVASTVQRESLRALSKKHPFLLVLDDLYSAAQAKAFRQLERECCILATSKSRRVLEDVDLPGSIVPLPPLSKHEAYKLFDGCTGGLPDGSSALRDKLVALCEGIPLAIKIAGLMIRRKPAFLAAVTALLETELDGIKAYDPDFTDGDASAHGGQTILAAVIGAAIRDFLTKRERDALLRLSVVPRQTNVPYEALKAFWSTNADDVDVIADALADLAMAEKDSNAQSLSLHDMIHTYLIGRARRPDPAQGEKPLKEYHKDLLRAYAEQCVEGGAERFDEGKTVPWWNHPGDGYFHPHLAKHLRAVRSAGKVLAELFDTPDWLDAHLSKCQAPYLILDDLNLLAEFIEKHGDLDDFPALTRCRACSALLRTGRAWPSASHLEAMAIMGKADEAICFAEAEDRPRYKFEDLLYIYQGKIRGGDGDDRVLREKIRESLDHVPVPEEKKARSAFLRAILASGQQEAILEECALSRGAELAADVVDQVVSEYAARGRYADAITFAEQSTRPDSVPLAISLHAAALANQGRKSEAKKVYLTAWEKVQDTRNLLGRIQTAGRLLRVADAVLGRTAPKRLSRLAGALLLDTMPHTMKELKAFMFLQAFRTDAKHQSRVNERSRRFPYYSVRQHEREWLALWLSWLQLLMKAKHEGEIESLVREAIARVLRLANRANDFSLLDLVMNMKQPDGSFFFRDVVASFVIFLIGSEGNRTTVGDLGRVLAHNGYPDTALTSAGRLSRTEFRCMALTKLGEALCASGDDGRAGEAFRRALDAWREIANPSTRMRVGLPMIKAHVASGYQEEARNALTELAAGIEADGYSPTGLGLVEFLTLSKQLGLGNLANNVYRTFSPKFNADAFIDCVELMCALALALRRQGEDEVSHKLWLTARARLALDNVESIPQRACTAVLTALCEPERISTLGDAASHLTVVQRKAWGVARVLSGEPLLPQELVLQLPNACSQIAVIGFVAVELSRQHRQQTAVAYLRRAVELYREHKVKRRGLDCSRCRILLMSRAIRIGSIPTIESLVDGETRVTFAADALSAMATAHHLVNNTKKVREVVREASQRGNAIRGTGPTSSTEMRMAEENGIGNLALLAQVLGMDEDCEQLMSCLSHLRQYSLEQSLQALYSAIAEDTVPYVDSAAGYENLLNVGSRQGLPSLLKTVLACFMAFERTRTGLGRVCLLEVLRIISWQCPGLAETVMAISSS